MTIHPQAGQPISPDDLVDIDDLVARYHDTRPDPGELSQRVAFGTSGHRGSSLHGSFCEPHIVAICQAIVEHRQSNKINGPLFVGKDTHALSEPAFRTAVEVFVKAGVAVHVQTGGGYTPTPAISHAILTYNRGRTEGLADGVVITPSHNPPEDGGFKYNPPHGGPAGGEITGAIEKRANELLASPDAIARTPFERAINDAVAHDYITPYVADLAQVVDMKTIAGAGLSIGVDPMGGSGIDYWDPIAERYGIKLDVVNRTVDPTFAFMPADHDGKIRIDCSSPFAMAGLVALADKFDVAFGNDPDYDRHGIVTRGKGVMNPNHFLSAAVSYLFRTRKEWGADVAVGKTLVSSSMIDQVAKTIGRRLYEVPVGFKWFVEPLMSGACGFGGEESSGASFLRFDGSVWTTDKDGIVMDLLAAEMTAVTGEDPAHYYRGLETRFGQAHYERMDAPASREQKEALKNLTPDAVTASEMAGDPITARLTQAPGNNAPIGGLKVVTDSGWFAARPSGTEDIYKIYAESFVSRSHLRMIQEEAKQIVDDALNKAGV